MSTGRHALHRAIRKTAGTEVRKRQNAKRGQVVRTNPLTVRVNDFAHDLTVSNDLEVSQWMRLYDSVVGIQKGDVVLVDQDDVDWVLYDVVSDSDVVRAFDGWNSAAGPS